MAARKRLRALGVVAALAGSLVAVTPETASATVYSGTVNCAGHNVVGLWINQAGNSGWASWYKTGFGSANWSYNFNSNQYSVTVGCGGTPQQWDTRYISVANGLVYPWQGTDWACDEYNNYCVLS